MDWRPAAMTTAEGWFPTLTRLITGRGRSTWTRDAVAAAYPCRRATRGHRQRLGGGPDVDGRARLPGLQVDRT